MNDNDSKRARLQKLEQQKEKIQKKIALAKNRISAQDRKDDTRRKILTGAVLIEAAENDTNLKGTIDTLLNAKLTRNNDRALFDLPPLPGKSDNADRSKTGS